MKQVEIKVPKNFASKLELLKEVNTITGFTLKESKNLVDSGKFVLKNVQDATCERLKYKFPDIEITESPNLIEGAKQAVYYHSNCVLLTKEEYQELCKYKGLYLDLKGEITKMAESWK